jgi:hypothetical protein
VKLPCERIDVDSREGKAFVLWKATTDEGVNRRMQYTSGSGEPEPAVY